MNNQVDTADQNSFLDPKELAEAFEHTMHFVKGQHDALPDMMQHTGRILLKLSNKLSTTQMVLLVGALTLGAIFMVKRVEEALTDDEDQDNEQERKSLPKASGKSSSGGGSGNQRNSGQQ